MQWTCGILTPFIKDQPDGCEDQLRAEQQNQTSAGARQNHRMDRRKFGVVSSSGGMFHRRVSNGAAMQRYILPASAALTLFICSSVTFEARTTPFFHISES